MSTLRLYLSTFCSTYRSSLTKPFLIGQPLNFADCVSVKRSNRLTLVLMMLMMSLQAGCRLDMASRTDGGQVTLPSDLLATRQCSDSVQRILVTAAAALGLQVGLQGVPTCKSELKLN